MGLLGSESQVWQSVQTPVEGLREQQVKPAGPVLMLGQSGPHEKVKVTLDLQVKHQEGQDYVIHTSLLHPHCGSNYKHLHLVHIELDFLPPQCS